MPSIPVRRWNGSLVTSLDQESTVPGDFSVLKNFVYDRNGLPTVRGGRRVWGNTSISSAYFQGLYHFKQGWFERRPQDFIIAYVNGTIQHTKFQLIGSTPWTQIHTGLETDLIPSFTTLREWLIFASNSESQRKPLYWNGTASEMSQLSTAPDARIVAQHAGRLWVVDQENPSQLWYSEPYSPNGWRLGQGAGFLAVAPGDGGHISALIPGYAGEMIIGKDSPSGGSIYRLSGLSEANFSVSPLSTTIGPFSSRCVSLVADRDVYFASRRGIHSLRRVQEYGDLESQDLDSEVSDRWRKLPEAQKLQAVAVDDYEHDQWILFVDTDGDLVNDYGWVFNYRHGNSRRQPKLSDLDFGATAAAMILDKRGGKNVLLTGGLEWCWIEFQETSKDETSSGTFADIDWEAELHPIDADDSITTKGWKDLWLVYDGWGEGDITVNWYCDNQWPDSTTIPMNPDALPTSYKSGTKLNETRLAPIWKRSKSIIHLRRGGVALKLKFSGTRGRTALRGFTIEYDPGIAHASAGRWFAHTLANQR